MNDFSPSRTYIEECRKLADTIQRQEEDIRKAADWFASSILEDRLVHVFGSGHSRIMVEEMWPRYGSFPGFNPIVELSLTFHNLVVGANGQRQAMYLENVSGFAERILRNFDVRPADSALIISSGGTSNVTVEMAELFREKGNKVVVIVSLKHAKASTSKRKDGKKLMEFADLVLDTGAPVGDAMISIPGLEAPVSPGSTIGGIMIINALKAEIALRLTKAGKPPTVLTAPSVIGPEKSADAFEKAYDEHARRMAELYKNLGNE